MGIVRRNSLLVVAIGGGECLGDISLIQNEMQPFEIRLIGICGGIAIWLVRRRSARAMNLCQF